MLRLLCKKGKYSRNALLLMVRTCEIDIRERHVLHEVVPCCFTCIGVCMVAMGWSMEVKAEMADMRTSSLTSTLPCTRVCVKGEGGTVM